jgi:hypothetical protein
MILEYIVTEGVLLLKMRIYVLWIIVWGKYGVGSHDHDYTHLCFIQVKELEEYFKVAPRKLQLFLTNGYSTLWIKQIQPLHKTSSNLHLSKSLPEHRKVLT